MHCRSKEKCCQMEPKPQEEAVRKKEAGYYATMEIPKEFWPSPENPQEKSWKIGRENSRSWREHFHSKVSR